MNFCLDTTAWYGTFAQTGTKIEPKRYVMGAGPKVRTTIREMVMASLFGKEVRG